MPIMTKHVTTTGRNAYVYAAPSNVDFLLTAGWTVYLNDPISDDMRLAYITPRDEPPNLSTEALADWERELLDAGTAPVPEPDTFLCVCCNEECEGEKHTVSYQRTVCQDCFDAYAWSCEWCNKTYLSDDEQYYCNHPQASELCENCFTAVVYCEGCGDYYDTDEYSSCPNMCDRGDDGALHDYGYKPYPMFYTTTRTHTYDDMPAVLRTAPFMGFELEMEAEGNYTVDEGVYAVDSFWGAFAYCKHDSSLRHGLELVTHPFTLEYAQDRIDWTLLDRLRGMGFRSWNTDTAGMHVHVNRATFTGQAHLYRFAQLVYKNEGTCKAFAGRSSEYASFADGYQKGHLAKVVKGECHSNRGAVNMLNSSTIEVRIFRGSLKPQRVLANLEFVHAAVEYTRTLPVRDVVQGGLSWRAFATWILDNRTTYPHLFSYLDLEPTASNKTHDPEYASY